MLRLSTESWELQFKWSMTLPSDRLQRSIAPVRHPVKLTLEPSSAVVGAAVYRMPPLEIPLPPERRQTMSVPHRLRS
jgi:hypothetical protein